MNYQHAFHVGKVPDVFKHIVIMQLLKYLKNKPTPLCYMETHTGKALYHLEDSASQKTRGYEAGIAQLFSRTDFLHEAIEAYVQLIKRFNEGSTCLFYPGSGLIARECLHETDTLVLCELNPPVYEALYGYFKKDKHVHIHQRNGYEVLTGLLPPKQNRGLVVIDPPFEAHDEFKVICNALKKAVNSWPKGMYAIWYPIKEHSVVMQFYRELKTIGFTKILISEFWESTIHLPDNRLGASGMIVINPPWQFDHLLQTMLPKLLEALNLNAFGKVKVEWLVNETD